jgi:hypothetical protein
MTRTPAALVVMTLRGPVTLGKKAPTTIRAAIPTTQAKAFLRH